MRKLAEHKSNREYKSSLFVSLFCEPEKMLELYNAINGTDYPADTQVDDATLKDVLFMDRINDLAFIVDGKVVILVEHQSTISKNMPLRLLLYLGRVYEQIVDNKLLYLYERVNIPAPEFIVVYNGKEDLPDQTVLRLSDSFEMAPELCGRYPLDLEVMVYNINRGRNAAIVGRSETLGGYVVFIDKAKRFINAGFGRAEAFTRAINECIDEGILGDYLMKHGSEVYNMLMQEWNWDKALDARFSEGDKHGFDRSNAETARRMLSLGFSIENIVLCTGLSHEKVRSFTEPSSSETVS